MILHLLLIRHKKKKIPLCTGEEIDMDLGDTEWVHVPIIGCFSNFQQMNKSCLFCSADSPVLWLRVDPDMSIMRSVHLEQPDFMWQYLLRYERCVVSQCLVSPSNHLWCVAWVIQSCSSHQAISALENFPTPKTRLALTDTIENDQCFYRVRVAAAKALVRVSSSI